MSEDALKATGVLPEHIKLPRVEEPPGLKLAGSTTPSDLAYRARISGAVEGSATVGQSHATEAEALVGTAKVAAKKAAETVSP